jgi:hypothetical protein
MRGESGGKKRGKLKRLRGYRASDMHLVAIAKDNHRTKK